MPFSAAIAALELPAAARVGKRVPKKLLLDNGAPTAADKRAIGDGIDELFWVAALKPATLGVPEFRDAAREYLELAVLTLTLRPGARGARLAELVHRAIPYPVLLLRREEAGLVLSLAHLRQSQGAAGQTVLDGVVIESPLGEDALSRSFLASLASPPSRARTCGLSTRAGSSAPRRSPPRAGPGASNWRAIPPRPGGVAPRWRSTRSSPSRSPGCAPAPPRRRSSPGAWSSTSG
jgi:hypothetical protein